MKCPVCNSTKYKQGRKGKRCLKCGYINKNENNRTKK